MARPPEADDIPAGVAGPISNSFLARAALPDAAARNRLAVHVAALANATARLRRACRYRCEVTRTLAAPLEWDYHAQNTIRYIDHWLPYRILRSYDGKFR